MKNLYLIRHAKSSWKDMSLSDFQRPLNKRGKTAAPLMGEKLKEKRILPDHIISSPAKRAWTTARVIAHAIDFPTGKMEPNENVYAASYTSLLEIVNSVDDANETIFLFGHNPGFTDLSNYLTNQFIDNVPTCGIVHIQFEVDFWSEVSGGNGQLVSFDYPKRYGDY